MAIKFGGEFEIKRTPEEVYDFLTDPQKFAPLLPDFQACPAGRYSFYGEN
jgi:carbon monoxide dehydrogenase subunit G